MPESLLFPQQKKHQCQPVSVTANVTAIRQVTNGSRHSWKANQVYDSLHSFRPISFGKTMSELLEKIILNRLSWYASFGDWLSKDQHGFWPAWPDLQKQFIENNVSIKLYSADVFLDNRSASDSAWLAGCPDTCDSFISSASPAHFFASIGKMCDFLIADILIASYAISNNFLTNFTKLIKTLVTHKL